MSNPLAKKQLEIIEREEKLKAQREREREKKAAAKPSLPPTSQPAASPSNNNISSAADAVFAKPKKPQAPAATPSASAPSTPQRATPAKQQASFGLDDVQQHEKSRKIQAQENTMNARIFLLGYMKDHRREFEETELRKVLSDHGKKLTEKQLNVLFETLRNNNPKCEYNPLAAGGKGTFAYKSKFSASNKDELLALLQHEDYRLSGIDVTLLQDTYNEAKQDLEQLKQSPQIYTIFNENQRVENMYYNDQQHDIKVDPHVKQMWRMIPKVSESELYDKLKQNKLREMLDFVWEADMKRKKIEAERDELEARTKKKRNTKSKKLTNDHLNLELTGAAMNE